MSKLPLVDAKTFEKLLLSLGFEIKKQKGSHVFYRHPDSRYTTPSPQRPDYRQILNQSNTQTNRTYS